MFSLRLHPFLLALFVRLKIISALAVVVAVVSQALVRRFHSLFTREAIEKSVSVWIHTRGMAFKFWTTHLTYDERLTRLSKNATFDGRNGSSFV